MRPVAIAAPLLAVLLGRPTQADVPGAGREVAWRSDLEGSRQAARTAGKPLLVVFR
jgi:hypothetical protein